MNFRKLFKYGSFIALVIGGYLVFANQQGIKDWWYLRSFTPSTQIAELASSAGLSDHGTDYFYVSNPELDDKQQFNQNCPFEEQTIVLGCYDGKRIYILDINAKELDGVETVTAAHEMLHAAYERLSDDKKAEVDRMVNDQFNNTDNARIKELIAEYDSSDQALINNELHSILPTELRQLSPELEAYYDDYFDDRQKVVSAAERYEAVFVRLDDRLKGLESQLAGYKTQIEAFEGSLKTMSKQIEEGRAELDQLEKDNKIDEYNAKVPQFNSLVRQYNSTIESLKSVVAKHNELVKQINETALKHNDLVNTINSNYQEL